LLDANLHAAANTQLSAVFLLAAPPRLDYRTSASRVIYALFNTHKAVVIGHFAFSPPSRISPVKTTTGVRVSFSLPSSPLFFFLRRSPSWTFLRASFIYHASAIAIACT